MWLFHFVAAVGLVAALPPPTASSSAAAAPVSADGIIGGPSGVGGSEMGESVWLDFSDREPVAQPTGRTAEARSARSKGRSLLSGLARPSRGGAGGAGTLLPPQLHQVLPPSAAAPHAAAPSQPVSQPPSQPPSQPASQPPSPSIERRPQLSGGAAGAVALQQLVEMGFERGSAEAALVASGGSSEAALQLLLDGPAQVLVRPARPPACLRACVPACLRACVLARLRACVTACLRACVPSHIPPPFLLISA